MAFVQSEIEKKSSSTLNDPQNVQMKGNAAIVRQTITNKIDAKRRAVGILFTGEDIMLSFYDRAKSAQGPGIIKLRPR